MNAAFSLTGDPELDAAVPQRPRVLPEIAWIPLSATRVLAAGSLDVVLLPSHLGGTSLIELLAMLDGSHSLHEIADGNAVASLERKRLMRLLHRAGLLEDGHREEGGSAYHALAMDQTRLHCNRARASAHGLRPVVCANLPDSLLHALQSAGLVVVESGVEGDPAFQLVLLDCNGRPANALAMIPGVPLLAIRFHGNAVDIGPWIQDEGGVTLDALGRHIASETSNGVPLAESRTLLEAFAAHALGLLVSGSAPMVLTSTLDRTVMECEGPIVERIPVAPLCDRLQDTGDDLHDRLRARAESAMPAFRYVGSKAHEAHHSPRNLMAALEIQEAGKAPLTEVPGQALELSERVLALLSMSFGYVATEAGLRRLAPSGGNLGSPEPLLWVQHRGALQVLRYLPLEGKLERVLTCSCGGAGRASLGILCMGNREKMARKYGRFGETLTRLDAGVAWAFFHAAAQAQSILPRRLSDPGSVPEPVRDLIALRDHHYVALWAVELQPVTTWSTKLPFRQALARRRHANALERRRAIRRFSGPGVTPPQFAKLVHAARMMRVAGTRPRSVSSDLIAIIRLRNAAEGTQQLFRQGRDGTLHALDCPPVSPELFLQRSLDQAPYALFLLCDLDSALHSRRTQALDDLLLESGEWMGRLWLSLSAHGLGGCPCGAAVEVDLLDALPSGLGDMSLLASFVAGRPAP